MKINLSKVGKRYNREWIFRDLSFSFEAPKHYAITGPNGSGKSTLLQIIAGAAVFNEGDIEYFHDAEAVSAENIFGKIALAAPYLEVVEEMTLSEFFLFHGKMKGWIEGFSLNEIIHFSGLSHAAHKQIRYYSSGMKQRVKLAQAIFSKTPVVLLDEPLTNLDEEGISLYNDLVKRFCKDRLLIISSNDKKEYAFCDSSLDMRNFK